MDRPTIEVVGTPDLPRLVSDIFGDKLLPAHEKIRVPDGKGGLALIGYRVSFMEEGKPMLSNVLVGDDGITFYEDDVQEADRVPDTVVPCRRDYFVCNYCLREIGAHAYNIEGLGEEDRPYPSIEDAWDEVEGCDGFCGGSYCANPPQRVVWTKADGTAQAQNFPSTGYADVVIAGIVQWAPDLQRPNELERTPEETVEAYEMYATAGSGWSLGQFLRLDLDDHTGEPQLPGEAQLYADGKVLVDQLNHKEIVFHGITFVVGWSSDTKRRKEPGWFVYPKTPLPEPSPLWR